MCSGWCTHLVMWQKELEPTISTGFDQHLKYLTNTWNMHISLYISPWMWYILLIHSDSWKIWALRRKQDPSNQFVLEIGFLSLIEMRMLYFSNRVAESRCYLQKCILGHVTSYLFKVCVCIRNIFDSWNVTLCMREMEPSPFCTFPTLYIFNTVWLFLMS